jgi:hypothetical protein
MKRLIILALLLLFVPFAHADDPGPPGFPQEFRGEITYYDKPIDGSFSLTIQNGETISLCPIADDGRYGYASSADKCLVDGSKGDELEFYISGSKVGDADFHTSNPGDYTRKDFDVDDILISSQDFIIDFSGVKDLEISTNIDGLFINLEEKNSAPTAYGDSDVVFMRQGDPILAFEDSFTDVVYEQSCETDCSSGIILGGSKEKLEGITGLASVYVDVPVVDDATSYFTYIRWDEHPNVELVRHYEVWERGSKLVTGTYKFYVTEADRFELRSYYYLGMPHYNNPFTSWSIRVLGDVDISHFVDAVTGMTLETQDENDNFGYTLINGLELDAGAPKTVYMDKISTDANYLCIKDSEVDSVLDISDACDAADEHKIPLEGGEVDGYKVTLIDGATRYKIEGTAHTAVKEVILENPHKIAVADSSRVDVTVNPNTFTVVSQDIVVTNNHALDYDNLYFSLQDLTGKWTVNQNVKISANNLEDLPSVNNPFSISSGESKTFKMSIVVPKQADIGTAGLVGSSVSLYQGGTFVDSFPIELNLLFNDMHIASDDDDDDDDDDDSSNSNNNDDSDSSNSNSYSSHISTPAPTYNVPVATMNSPNSVTGASASNQGISGNMVLGVVVFWLSIGTLTFSMLLRAKVNRIKLLKAKKAKAQRRRK